MWGVLLVAVVLAGGCRARFVDEAGSRAASVGLGDLTGVDLGAASQLGGGTFIGRAGHLGSGSVALFDYPSQDLLEIRFGADFFCSDVPGPVVVLTARDDLGTSLDALSGDLEVATLKSTSGAQSYFLHGSQVAGTRDNVFVFCKPYGLEVAKAALASP
jgi:hypothetical protein